MDLIEKARLEKERLAMEKFNRDLILDGDYVGGGEHLDIDNNDTTEDGVRSAKKKELREH